MRRALRREVGVVCALVFLLSVTNAPLRAEWPLFWDFAGSSDVAMAGQVGPGGDLWVLSQSHLPGVGMPRAVVLRIGTDGVVVWATDDPGLPFPTALAVSADGSALAIGRSEASLVATAFTPTGGIAWTRSRGGAALDTPFTGPHAAPIWDDGAAAWRIPTGLGGDFAVLSFAANGDALPDRLWSPPAGTGRVTSILPRAGGGLLVSGIVEDAPPPGWWTVALDAAGAEVWKHFEDGETPPGAFSGAFLLSGDPVRLWADDETLCGRFSLRLWSLDATTGAPLWGTTWPTTTFPGCDSFTPTSATLAGGRILVSGTGDVASLSAHFDPIAISFDASSGETVWERTFVGATVGIRADASSVGGNALVASTLFPQPNPGPTRLWLSTWDRNGAACVAPFEVQPARLVTSLTTAASGSIPWLLVGNAYNFAGGTTDDLVIQRGNDPCGALFADSFESGDTQGWSSATPRARAPSRSSGS